MSTTSQKYRGRVWAPFGTEKGLGARHRAQKAYYDHGYRQPGEHYHATFEELLDCDLMGDEPHLRDLRAARVLTLSKREES